MIPVKLTVEGLYSYQKRQTIDFSRLTEAGLFGIFGAVGSGKSSILEAITFALYGETERLNSKEKRSYNMMNLKSDRAYIEFDFLNFENKKFRATREYRRNSKRFEDIKTVGAIFYEWRDENWIPLNHTKTEEIIGLSYENFKRTIIIPQGQFKEFIELKATNRTQMMKEIFNLHRFDLQHKAASLNQENLIKISHLEGKLSAYTEISETQITELKESYKRQNEQNNILQKELIAANERFHILKELKSDIDNLNDKKKSFDALTIQKTEKETLKKQLELYERIYSAFGQLLIDQQRTKNALNSISKDFDENTQSLKSLVHKNSEIRSKLEIIQPVYERLEELQQKLDDYERLIDIVNLNAKLKSLQSRYENGELKVKEVTNLLQDTEESIKKLENEHIDLKSKTLDNKLLMDVGNWFLQQQNLIEHQEYLQKQQQQLSESLLKLYTDLKQKQIRLETFENDFSNTENKLLEEKSVLDDQHKQLYVQQQLVEFANELHKGKACPLCGSKEHPKVLENGQITYKLDKIEFERKTIEKKLKELQSKKQEAYDVITNIKIFQKNKVNLDKTLKNHQQRIQNHFDQFVWKDFDANNFMDFEEKRREDHKLKQLIESKNNEIASKRTFLEKQRLDKERFEKALANFQREENEYHFLIEQNKTNLKQLNWIDFQLHTTERLKNDYKILKEKISKIKIDYKDFTHKLQQNQVELAAQQASLESIKHQKTKLEQNCLEIQKEIENRLTTHSVTLEKVEELLQNPLEVVALRKELENFYIEYATLKNLVISLERKLQNTHFDATEFENLGYELKIKEKNSKEAFEQLTKIKTELERLKKALKDKQELQAVLNQLQKRADNLKVLTNLFKGAGFVQYVSSVYLKQLCVNANLRFHKMTKNQLSLQINESNDFEVIDYLNEGRSRSVKTLSGGQFFQVSLCLALALAESVQAHSKVEKNFFFIDEGFGTQDTEAVNIVFETLNQLRKENRVVGIISHVDALKERMPVALSVTKNEETGSSISISD